MVLRGFERRLERMVEGTFARAFRSGVRPVELGRRLSRAMDDDRSVDVRGRTITPNHFEIALAEADYLRFGEVRDTLRSELVEAAREHAVERGYTFMGPADVVLFVDAKLYEGQFQVDAGFRQGSGGTGAGALVFADGGRLALTDKPVVIGRLADCDIVIDDPNASRKHAEVRPDGVDYVVYDLGSTNGTRVNGSPVRRHTLSQGDHISIGTWQFMFEAN
jgi:hypothetical protein